MIYIVLCCRWPLFSAFNFVCVCDLFWSFVDISNGKKKTNWRKFDWILCQFDISSPTASMFIIRTRPGEDLSSTRTGKRNERWNDLSATFCLCSSDISYTILFVYFFFLVWIKFASVERKWSAAFLLLFSLRLVSNYKKRKKAFK